VNVTDLIAGTRLPSDFSAKLMEAPILPLARVPAAGDRAVIGASQRSVDRCLLSGMSPTPGACMRRRTRTVPRRTRYGSTLPHQRITMIDSDEGPWICCCPYASPRGRWHSPRSACRSRASRSRASARPPAPPPAGCTAERRTGAHAPPRTQHQPLDTGPGSIAGGLISSLAEQSI